MTRAFLVFTLWTMASVSWAFPSNWDSLKGCEKQDQLWDKILETKHKELPPMDEFGIKEIFYMSRQALGKKLSLNSDVAPEGWKKYIHSRGAVAKVKIISLEDHQYTGIFQGADCALVRLSLTYRPYSGLGIDKAVAPGLALKVLRDGTHSANVSALYSLNGQEQDHNFFRNPLSNIVPIGSGIGQSMMHRIFSKYTPYPERTFVKDMATYDVSGTKVKPVSPRQIFFVPSKDVASFSSKPHDVRNDFLKIAQGTHLYDIYALPLEHEPRNYDRYKVRDIAKLVKKSRLVGKIVTDSPFIASQFGDHGIFFKHEAKIKKIKYYR